ncbi:MAG: toxin HicA [Acidobacteriota bacterium]
MKANPKAVRFPDLCKVCDHYFGEARQRGTGHRVYKTPWEGDPRVNIQNAKGKAKAYQVKQVLVAIERLEANDGIEE